MSQEFWQWWNWVWSDAGGAWAGVGVAVIGFGFAVGSLRHLAQQNSLATDALKESRNAFVLTNRPRVRVRRVTILQSPDTGAEFIQARAEFANIGSTDARVFDTRGAIVFAESSAVAGDFSFLNSPKAPACVLRPGETEPFEFETGELEFQDFAGFRNSVSNCFAVGRICYLDDLHIRRETAFCRKLDFKSGRFQSVADPDFEYED